MADNKRRMTGGGRCRAGASLRFFTGVLLLLLAAGCVAVGPDYERPEMAVPQSWREGPDPALVPDQAVTRRWWTVFGDPLLERLIAEAEQDNLDLRRAVARVREARARLGVVRGEYVPRAEAQGSVNRQRLSENGLRSNGSTETLYGVGVDASWELDLFGRISRAVEAASADYQASEEDRGDVLVSLYAEVARTYFNIRTFQARLASADGNIDSQRQILELTRSRFDHGLATGLDVAQAEQVLAASQAEVPPLRIALTQAANTMGVLLGKPPGTLFAELSRPGPIPVPPEQVSVGVPANLLRQRPDIRRAERQLAAQTARIGIATADLYPTLSLSGSFAFEAVDAGDLFQGSSKAFGFGPTLRWLIFDGARVRSRIQVEDALTEQALYHYEQSVLNALNEAENALTEYLEQRTRLAALERSVQAARRSLQLATRLYKDGLVDFQNVLDAQRVLFDNESQLAAARGNTVINLVQLYRTLGGGWDPGGPPGAVVSQGSGDNSHTEESF
jgi:NodT family efflux transporter outer membrane factor (OMF) lipoprotein